MRARGARLHPRPSFNPQAALSYFRGPFLPFLSRHLLSPPRHRSIFGAESLHLIIRRPQTKSSRDMSSIHPYACLPITSVVCP